MNDELVFADETDASEGGGAYAIGAWKVLVVDDQEDVHNVTRLVLDDFAFEGRRVVCLSAYSGAEAKKIVAANPDIAVILLDVVMETNRAGLDVAQFIRGEARNHLVRIILRTGQPGEAPEREVVTELDINDYRQKTELTADRMVTAVTTAIRSYRDLKLIEESRRGLHLLAMSVAHQIRNRTIAIAGFANIIKRKTASSPDVGAHLETILEESSRLESMVSDVTRYASIEIGEMRAANIRDIIEDAMDRVEENGDDVKWEVFCPDQVVQVDPTWAVKAFAAILQNAVDFSGPEAKVRISVSPGRMACVVTVTDYGCGIREEDMPYIYDPFFSLKPDGSGMGLCIVRKVATAHQWDVLVDSHPDVGTTVRTVLPRRELTGSSE